MAMATALSIIEGFHVNSSRTTVTVGSHHGPMDVAPGSIFPDDAQAESAVVGSEPSPRRGGFRVGPDKSCKAY